MKKLLIDAISTNSGGAISHLKNLLLNFKNQNYFEKVDVFLPENTKKLMPKNKDINYITSKLFSKNLIFRILWQIIYLNFVIFKKNYSCVFITGSSHLILKKPVVTISQNLLPFSPTEINKYFFSSFYIKLKILGITQSLSFKLSEGIIFLHHYSKKLILNSIGGLFGQTRIVHHGLDTKTKKAQYNKNKYRLIYVSNIDYYKNQIFLLQSLDNFFEKYPKYKNKIIIEFYGSYYRPALIEFNNYLKNKVKNKKNFIYRGLKKSKTIYKDYKQYDTISLFSSSCENFSVSLIEGMSRGYPFLCVNLQPMKSVLGNSAVFYKNGSMHSFQKNLYRLLSSKKIQKKLSSQVYKRAKIFNKNITAKKTYNFLIHISKQYAK